MSALRGLRCWLMAATLLLALVPASTLADDFPPGATLSVLTGQVQVALGPFADYTDALDGQLVQAGDTVRTGPGGLALLTFFDGSESQLGPDSQMRIDFMEASPARRIMLFQAAGLSLNRVVPMAGGSFQTDTSTATGLVRGTTFVVAVDQPASEADQPTTSLVLLEDPDGHVGRVDVAAHADLPMVELTRAGEVGVASVQTAAKARLGSPALQVLTTAARDPNDALAASQAAEHARSLVVAARVALASGGDPAGNATLLNVSRTFGS
ncbi:MAG TPA: FecR family protein, partial [Chloroflexota bacterium]|nr:FecR family protein [Chloroflexota bacterium]